MTTFIPPIVAKPALWQTSDGSCVVVAKTAWWWKGWCGVLGDESCSTHSTHSTLVYKSAWIGGEGEDEGEGLFPLLVGATAPCIQWVMPTCWGMMPWPLSTPWCFPYAVLKQSLSCVVVEIDAVDICKSSPYGVICLKEMDLQRCTVPWATLGYRGCLVPEEIDNSSQCTNHTTRNKLRYSTGFECQGGSMWGLLLRHLEHNYNSTIQGPWVVCP